MTIKQQRLLSLGLTSLSVTGIVGTFIFTTKEAPLAKQKLKDISKKDKKKKLITFVKSYKKSLIFMGATIATTIGARVVGAKTEASLIATATMLDASLRKYKNKVKQVLGVEADKAVVKDIIKDKYDKPDTEPRDGEELFCEEHLGYFYAKPERIRDAYIEILKDLSGVNTYYTNGLDNGYVRTLADFVNWSGARLMSHTITKDDLNFGWSVDYLDQWYDISAITMDIDEEPNEDGAKMIYFDQVPVWNPELWNDYIHLGLNKDEYFKNCKSKHITKHCELYVQEKY